VNIIFSTGLLSGSMPLHTNSIKAIVLQKIYNKLSKITQCKFPSKSYYHHHHKVPLHLDFLCNFLETAFTPNSTVSPKSSKCHMPDGLLVAQLTVPRQVSTLKNKTLLICLQIRKDMHSLQATAHYGFMCNDMTHH